MRLPRASGVLLHPTSLPSAHGIGDLGPEARRWIDALAAAGQSWWQILPFGPTGFGDSPYQCFSSFAGNPRWVAPEGLVAAGLLRDSDLEPRPQFPPGRVHFGLLVPWKRRWLELAAKRLLRGTVVHLAEAFARFREREGWWLEEYALFLALKDTYGGAVWSDWEPAVARRKPAALRSWREKLAEQVDVYCAWQFFFFQQWDAVRQYAASRGVRILGDVPIFVAYDSADVWLHPELFFLDARGKPTVVAGVPPDYFSATGQLWGNPLYRWDVMMANGFRWWIDRIRHTLRFVDVVRIDHFIGFTRYWEIPAGAPNAVLGRYVPVPGAEFLRALRAALGALPLVAEDLGAVTPEVDALREQFELPGMKVLQFAFSSDANNRFLPHNYTGNFVVYTGTHDNDTTVGWYRTASPEERRYLRRYLGHESREVAWDLIRLGSASVADTCIVPVQDLLSLDSEARMNYPGRASGNWTWRLLPDQLEPQVWERLYDLTATYGRLPQRTLATAVTA